MDENISSMLSVLADMNACTHKDDELSRLIEKYDDGELMEDDLSMVAAAYSPMKYSEFLKKLTDR